jgi:hypothetical protein
MYPYEPHYGGLWRGGAGYWDSVDYPLERCPGQIQLPLARPKVHLSCRAKRLLLPRAPPLLRPPMRRHGR